MPEVEQQELLASLKERYVYDYETGRISHVNRDHPLQGSANRQGGYRGIVVRFKGNDRMIGEHQMAWALHYGRWPVGTIDHIDGNTTNNRIENLRECSMSENRANVELWWRPNSKTGVPGIEKDGSKYRLWIRGERYTFSDSYEAFYWGFLCGKRYKMN